MTAKRESDAEPLQRRENGDQKCCNAYCFYRTTTIIYGFVYFIIGLAALGVGLWVLKVKDDYQVIIDVLFACAIVLLVTAAVLLTTALLGILGAIREKLLPLRLFLAAVIIVFLLQVVFGILAYIYREHAIQVTTDKLKHVIHKYSTDDNVKSAFDKMQDTFDCCGIDSINDWKEDPKFSCFSNSSNVCVLPETCCDPKKLSDEICMNSPPNKSVYKECKTALTLWFTRNLDAIGATFLALAILHLLAIFLVYMFIAKLEDRIRLFTYRHRMKI